jgi:hypothetical protein
LQAMAPPPKRRPLRLRGDVPRPYGKGKAAISRLNPLDRRPRSNANLAHAPDGRVQAKGAPGSVGV